MKQEFEGLNVLITGASGGIGWALAQAFGESGAGLLLHAGARLESLQQRADQMPWRERATLASADVRAPGELEAMISDFGERRGRLDICIVNAGIWPSEDRALHEVSTERLRRVIETNLLGAMFTARSFLGQLADRGPRGDGRGASLCFIGSTAGRFGERGHSAYAATKAGLAGLTSTLKNEIVELDPWGRVNLVEPGWTVTDMTREGLANDAILEAVTATMPLRQLARPEDVAEAVLMLSSPRRARHLTGQTLTVAGGMEGRRLWSPGSLDAEDLRARMESS